MARAGTASVESQYPDFRSESTPPWETLHYDGAPGEASDATIKLTSGKPGETRGLTVTDAAGVTAGTGCTTVDAHTATCALQPRYGTPQANFNPADVDAKLGDGGDKLALDLTGMQTAVDGGDGNDELTGTITSVDTFSGGPGDDRLNGGGTPPAPADGPQPFPGGLPLSDDVLVGGPGADTFAGGPGTTVDYTDHIGSIHVDLEGDADDGSPGEGDMVGADVSAVTGGPGDDEIVGNDGPNHLNGGPGGDRIDGMGGIDAIDGGTGAGKDRIDGGAGDDAIVAGEGGGSALGGAGNDDLGAAGGAGTRLAGGAGADQLFGSGAREVIDGGPGSDHIDGLGGNDRILARDGAFDFIQCDDPPRRTGTAILDGADFVKACKRIERHGAAVVHGFDSTLGLYYEIGERLRIVAPRLGCPQDLRPRCAGTLEATLAGRVIGTGRFRVTAGRIGHGRINVSDVVDKAVKRDGSARVAVIARTRDSAGKKRTLRLSVLYTSG